MVGREDALVRMLAPHVPRGSSVLDVGSGNGLLAQRLASATGAQVTVTDIRQPTRKPSLPWVRMRSLTELSADDASVDVVTLSFVLHHIVLARDQDALLAEACRVSRRRVLLLEDTPSGPLELLLNKVWDVLLNAPAGVACPFTYRSSEAWIQALSTIPGWSATATPFRTNWPVLRTYQHSLIVGRHQV